MNTGDDNIRLVGSPLLDSHTGRVEIQYNYDWYSVCGLGFDIYDADVACRMVGYLGAETFYTNADKFGRGSGDILLSGLACTGAEDSLLQCSHDGLYETHMCTHEDDVGVVCRQWKAGMSAGTSEVRAGKLYIIGIVSRGVTGVGGWGLQPPQNTRPLEPQMK